MIMYEPGLAFFRTEAENRDPFLAWQRDDKAFFASGACHILAHVFLSLHIGEGYDLIFVEPIGKHPGNHLYASNGTWAFDFQGWTREAELLEATRKAYGAAYPGWDCQRIVIAEGLPAYIASGRHNLRSPEYFPYPPWERAYNYIKQFPPQPPAA